MKIAIKFGDNDFNNTFRGVLATIFEVYKFNEIAPTKKQLVTFINEISFGIYVARQLDYEGEKNHFESRRLRNWLKIDESRVLIDDEVDDLLTDSGYFANSETFILDTELDYPGNDPIYSY